MSGTRHLTFTAVDIGDGTTGVWRDLVPDAAAGDPLLVPGWREPEAEARARALVAEHMPELLPVLDRLAAELGVPGAATALSHTAFRPFYAGCSQTAVAGALVRNYDFDPDMCDRTVVRSNFLRPVIGMGDVLWGLLDGMNDAGLAVSLTFGGRFVDGPGFTALMIVRYLLETCSTVDEALAALDRLPITLAQNLTIVGPDGGVGVHLGPDRKPGLAVDACITNHQEKPGADSADSVLRQSTLRAALAEPADDPVEHAIAALLREPIYDSDYSTGMGTLYTAAYRPAEGTVDYVWPGHRETRSFADFKPGSWTVEVQDSSG